MTSTSSLSFVITWIPILPLFSYHTSCLKTTHLNAPALSPTKSYLVQAIYKGLLERTSQTSKQQLPGIDQMISRGSAHAKRTWLDFYSWQPFFKNLPLSLDSHKSIIIWYDSTLSLLRTPISDSSKFKIGSPTRRQQTQKVALRSCRRIVSWTLRNTGEPNHLDTLQNSTGARGASHGHLPRLILVIVGRVAQ